MSSYYNENDPFAAAWLRELIKVGHISPGDVDERDIQDVRPDDLRGYKQYHFFAGIGVWSYALRQAGWGDDEPVWTGSCPCQPFSIIARERTGASDARHLWPTFFNLIAECRPSIVLGEQVSSPDGRHWLAGVRTEMEGIGYAIGAADLCAAGFGSPQIRQRFYWVGDSEHTRLEGYIRYVNNIHEPGWDNEETSGSTGTTSGTNFWNEFDIAWDSEGSRRRVEPGTFPLAHGSPCRVGRLRGYGNALVAPQATAFIEAYLETRREVDASF